jgi:hypothetical protein
MSDSQTLYVRNPGHVAELEEWQRPRELRGGQLGNRAELLTDDLQSQRREDRHPAINATVAQEAVGELQFPPKLDPALQADGGFDAKPIATDIPVDPVVPRSKMAGGWFREDPW